MKSTDTGDDQVSRGILAQRGDLGMLGWRHGDPWVGE